MPTIGYIEKGKDWTEYLHGPAFVSICVHVLMISPEQPTSKPYALPVQCIALIHLQKFTKLVSQV